VVVVEEDEVSSGEDAEGEPSGNLTRKGPGAAAMEKAHKEAKVKLENRGLEVSNSLTGYGHGLEAAKGNVAIRGGRWYFECRMVNSGQMHLGWCTEDYNPQTNEGDCWTFDITSSQIYRKESNNKPYGEYCSGTDTIGCSLDVKEKTMCFYKNGNNMGVAFTDVASNDGNENTRFCAYIGLSRNTKAKFNFGKERFDYPIEEGFFPLHCPLSETEIKDLEKIFEKYKKLGIDLQSSKEDAGDVIQGGGAQKLQEDLGATDEDDPLLMVVAWKLNCQTTWEFTKDEFMNGFMLYGCSSLKSIQQKCEEWKASIRDERIFKQFYHFVFDYLRGDKKILMIESAELVWHMLIMPRKWGLYDKWMEYLKVKQVQCVNKDVWQQLAEFMTVYPRDLTEYDESAAWPLLFDEFHQWLVEGGSGGKKGDE